MARRTYLFKTFTCPDGHDTKKFVEAAEVAVMCAEEGCALAGVLPEVLESVFSVHGDALDYIDHNLGRHPVHITSKAQRRALMAAAGLEEFIRHTPVPGTDKSPFTIRWVTMDEKTLRNAQELVLRQAGVAPEPEPEPAPVANPFSATINDPETINALAPYMASDVREIFEREKAEREAAFAEQSTDVSAPTR